MTGRAPPSDLELRENLHKRMFIPPGVRKPLGGKREVLEKRFNRGGTHPLTNAGNQAKSLSRTPTSGASQLNDSSLTHGDIIDALTQLANGGNPNTRNRNGSEL